MIMVTKALTRKHPAQSGVFLLLDRGGPKKRISE